MRGIWSWVVTLPIVTQLKYVAVTLSVVTQRKQLQSNLFMRVTSGFQKWRLWYCSILYYLFFLEVASYSQANLIKGKSNNRVSLYSYTASKLSIYSLSSIA